MEKGNGCKWLEVLKKLNSESSIVLVAWLGVVLVLGLHGEGPLADKAMNLMYFFGGFAVLDLIRRMRK